MLVKFPGYLSYRLHLLIGFDAVKGEYGGLLIVVGGARPLMVVEGNPPSDADFGL